MTHTLLHIYFEACQLALTDAVELLAGVELDGLDHGVREEGADVDDGVIEGVGIRGIVLAQEERPVGRVVQVGVVSVGVPRDEGVDVRAVGISEDPADRHSAQSTSNKAE